MYHAAFSEPLTPVMLKEIEAGYLQAKQFVIKCFAHFPVLFQTYILSLIPLHL